MKRIFAVEYFLYITLLVGGMSLLFYVNVPFLTPSTNVETIQQEQKAFMESAEAKARQRTQDMRDQLAAPALEMQETVDFLLAPALLMQQSLDQDSKPVYPNE